MVESKFPKNIIAIGASTIYGEGDPVGGGFVTRLKSWHEQNNPKEHRVFNLGIAAESIVKITKRFYAEVSVRKPDLIIYYPGLNDFLRIGSASARCRSDYNQVVESLNLICQQSRTLCPLLVMTPIPPAESLTTPFMEKFYFLRSDAQKLSELIKSLAANNLCQIFDIFDSWSASGDNLDLLYDGLHCNALGHQKLFEDIRNYLIKTYQ